MAEGFRKGATVIRETAESKGGKQRFTPNIYWKDGDTRTLVFVTPIDDVPKVRLHQFIRVPDDSREQGFRYEMFLCKKDPSVDGHNAHCELCDDIGHNPDEKFVALAVELDQIKEGKRTVGLKIKTVTKKRDDGVEVDYPRWGMVIQGARNFFAWLAAYDENKGDITDVAFEVHREGSSVDTKYHFFKEDAAVPELDDVNVPDLFDLLREMASEEKYAMLSAVEAGSQPSYETNGTSTQSKESAFERIKSAIDSEESDIEPY